MRPICVPCRVEMRCTKNGRILWETGHDDYGYRHCDEYICPVCKAQILSRFAPTRIHRSAVTDDEIKTAVPVA